MQHQSLIAEVYRDVIGLWGIAENDEPLLIGHDDGMTDDCAARMLACVQIYSNLRFMPPDMAHAWPRTPNGNPLFGGKPPLEMMMAGREGLEQVLKLLKAENGGPQ